MLAGIVKVETWGRRLAAWWRGDPQNAKAYRDLSSIVRDVVLGQSRPARRRLQDAMQRIDVRVGI
jgi:hypothetical protein